ncbi:hypothetical protein [Streptacidiphilus sp. PAMC 29251]
MYAGPGLSWAELIHLAESEQEGGEGLSDASQRLIALLPMLGDADTPGEARDIVAQALSRRGITAGQAQALADALN